MICYNDDRILSIWLHVRQKFFYLRVCKSIVWCVMKTMTGCSWCLSCCSITALYMLCVKVFIFPAKGFWYWHSLLHLLLGANIFTSLKESITPGDWSLYSLRNYALSTSWVSVKKDLCSVGSNDLWPSSDLYPILGYNKECLDLLGHLYPPPPSSGPVPHHAAMHYQACI